MKAMTCGKCGYQWKARTTHPKACPECKTRTGLGSKLGGRPKKAAV